MPELFRPQAIAHQSKLITGQPVAAYPVSWTILTTFFVCIGACVITFLATVNIARKETASGVLTLSHGEIRVMPPKAGTVVEVDVEDGQSVVAGQTLARVSMEQDLANSSLNEQLISAIDDQRVALRNKLTAFEAGAPLATRAMQQKISAEQKQREDLMASLSARSSRLDLSRRAYEAGHESAIAGLISGDTQRQRQYDYLAQQQTLSDFTAQLSQLSGAIAQDHAAFAKLASDQSQTRNELLEQIASLDERETTVAGSRGYVLKAKIAGRITALQAKVGQPADLNRPLLTIVPLGSELRAEVFVPSRAIAFIKPGQKVRLVYDAFPIERFGASFGVVQEVSAAILKPDEVGTVVSVKEPVYRIIVRPLKLSVNTYGVETPLRSGIALTADVILEKRSFLRLLMDPILAAGTRTIGE